MSSVTSANNGNRGDPAHGAGSMGGPGSPSFRGGALHSKYSRLMEISACCEASQLYPDLNSVEALRRDGFTERVIAVLQRDFVTVSRAAIAINDVIIVPGAIPNNGPASSLLYGPVDAVGIRIVDTSKPELVGVVENCSGNAIGGWWRQDEQVVLPLLSTLVLPRTDNVLLYPIGNEQTTNVTPPVSKKRGRERERESSEEEDDDRKVLSGFFIRCADGKMRVVTTKSGAADRVIVVQGLLRIWDQETSDIFLRDLVLDFARIRRAADSSLPEGDLMEEYLEAELRMFADLGNVAYLPVVKSDDLLKKLVMGSWDLTDPHRLHLKDFATSTITKGWALDIQDSTSKLIMLDTVRNLQLCLSAVWGSAFGKAISSFIDLQQERKQLAATHHHPAAYMAARLEAAMHRFHVIVFAELGGTQAVTRRTSAGCAQILKKCMTEAADHSKWEVYPFALFFAPDGYYVRHCKQAAVSVAGKSTPVAGKAGLTSATTTRNKERREAKKKARAAKTSTASTVSTTASSVTPIFCAKYVAKMVKGPGATGCERGKSCRFSHDHNAMKKTSRVDVLTQFQALKGLQGGEETRSLIAASDLFLA